MNLSSLLRKYSRVIKFGLVGCVNTLVDFLCYSAALGLLKLSPGRSQIIGYCCGIACSFLLNRRFTFRDGERRLWGQIILFLVVNLCTLGLSVLGINALTALGVNGYLAKLPVTALVMVCNYLGYKHIVFRVK